MATTRPDHTELVNRFSNFFREYYRDAIGELAQKYPKDQRSLQIDWMDLYRFDQDLAEDFVKQPEELREYGEEALRRYDLPIDVTLADVTLCTRLPDDGPHSYSVDQTRSEHRGEYLALRGQVTKRSDVKPKATEISYDCHRCGTPNPVPQRGSGQTEPHECRGCERQGPFKIDWDRSEFIDHQLIRLQQPPEEAHGHGSHVDVPVEGDLVGQIEPGDRAAISGVLHLEQQDKESRVFDPYLKGYDIQVKDTDFEQIAVDEHKDDIEAIASGERGDPYDLLVQSLAPRIHGHSDKKLAIMLQLFGGVPVKYPNGEWERGDSHILLLGDPGCHAPGTELLTYDGRRVAVEDIEPGDSLMGPDSTPRTVTQTASGRQQMYEIQPNKGDPFVVNEDHILTIVKSGSAGRNEDGDIIDISVADYLDWPETPQHQHKLLRTGVEFDADTAADLPINPYFLGVLIGDGTLHDTTPSIDTDEADVLDQLDVLAEQSGVSAVERSNGVVSFSGGAKGRPNPLTAELRSLGLDVRSPDKQLPRMYRTSSRQQRLDLLAGLIDTDGTFDGTHKAGYKYSTASEQLASDVAYLARSLGLCATIRDAEMQLDTWDNPRTYFYVHISGDCSKVPCRVERKQAVERGQIKNVLRTGFSVEPVGVGKYHGVALAEDPHYVMGDFTITHNTAKSSILRAVNELAPRASYASGKGATEAGMTAAAVPDDFGDTKWSLEAGALVRAHKGIACVDEIDKVPEEVVSSMHPAMADQVIDVHKAGINATLPCQTAVLAAGNPKYGRFDPYEPIGDQADLGPTLLSRFDLIFILQDDVDPDVDERVADNMIEGRQLGVKYTDDPHTLSETERSEIEPAIDFDLLRAYIAHAKRSCYPRFRDQAVAETLKKTFMTLRLANDGDENAPVPVTRRKLQALHRLAEASARVRLSDTITDADVARARELVMSSLKAVGIDPETDQLDADVIEVGRSTSQRERRRTILHIIDELSTVDEGAQIDEIIEKAGGDGIDQGKVEHALTELQRQGMIYEQQTNHYRTV